MIVAKEIFCLNEQGKRRNNEDSIYPPKSIATNQDKLFVVCDGVGGENKGEVASEIVCMSVYEYINNQGISLIDKKEAINKAIRYANGKLVEYAGRDPMAKRMSTTLSLVFLGEQSVMAAWCGDTRVHHIREGRVMWKSDDHSLVAELVKNGEITAEEAKCHPRKNIITRSLNALNTNNAVDFHEIENCRNDDYLLLCTDGFLEQIDENLIFSVLSNEKEKNKARQFFSLCEGKTRDNFSMYLIKVGYTENEHRKLPTYRLVSSYLIVFLCLVTIIVMFLLLRKNETVSQKSLQQREIKKAK